MKELVLGFQRGEVEFTEIIPHYENMIYKLIHSKFNGLTGCEFSDLYNAGLMGLYSACQQYDIERGTAVSTFVYWKVFGEMTACRREVQSIGWRDEQDSLENMLEENPAWANKMASVSATAFEKETVLRQTINECLMDQVDHGIIYGILERGHTQSEIGRLVGMAQQNIGRRMKKTIPRLQQHLIAQGYAI